MLKVDFNYYFCQLLQQEARLAHLHENQVLYYKFDTTTNRYVWYWIQEILKLNWLTDFSYAEVLPNTVRPGQIVEVQFSCVDVWLQLKNEQEKWKMIPTL